MARENFSVGGFYNIIKNQDNPIKTVGRDSFWAPKPLKYKFLGVTQPQGSHSPYILGDTTRPRHITCVLVWSKSNRRRLRKTLHKQTDKQTLRKQWSLGREPIKSCTSSSHSAVLNTVLKMSKTRHITLQPFSQWNIASGFLLGFHPLVFKTTFYCAGFMGWMPYL